MSAEQKTPYRGYIIVTVLERLPKGRARLSAKVLADDLAAPIIEGLKRTIDLELATAAKAAKSLKPAKAAMGVKSVRTAKPRAVKVPAVAAVDR